jgi:hypothetical protein
MFKFRLDSVTILKAFGEANFPFDTGQETNIYLCIERHSLANPCSMCLKTNRSTDGLSFLR